MEIILQSCTLVVVCGLSGFLDLLIPPNYFFLLRMNQIFDLAKFFCLVLFFQSNDGVPRLQ